MFAKANNVTLSDDLLFINDTHFGGTGNSFVNMTETCRFSMKRFKNHVKLYNYYSTLATEDMYLKLFTPCHM